MFPSQPQTRSHSLNQKPPAANTRILLKDEIKPLGVIPVGRKKPVNSFISMDVIQRKELMAEALRVQKEDNSRTGNGIHSNLVGNYGAGEQESGTGNEELAEAIRMQQDENSGTGYESQSNLVGNHGAGEQNNESENAKKSTLVGEVKAAKVTFACENILKSITVGEGACETNNKSKVVGEVEYFEQKNGSGAGNKSTVVGSIGKNYSQVEKNDVSGKVSIIDLDNGELAENTTKNGGFSVLTNPRFEGKQVDEETVKKPWTEILKPKKVVQRMKFEYHMPEILDGKVVIKPPLSVDIQGGTPWLNCLVGYFFEKRVAFHTMEFHANRIWKNRGLTDVIMNEDGFFFFKFACEEDLMEILEEGVCLVEGKPLILQM